MYRLRGTCECGGAGGRVEERNGQAVVFCDDCGRYQYNAPKKERGLVPAHLRRNGVSVSLRYRVMERAGFRCEFCGSAADESTMHVGHLLSVDDCRKWELEDRFADEYENLAWLCETCNLGQGARSFTLHQALVFCVRRAIAAVNV